MWAMRTAAEVGTQTGFANRFVGTTCLPGHSASPGKLPTPVRQTPTAKGSPLTQKLARRGKLPARFWEPPSTPGANLSSRAFGSIAPAY